MKFEHSDETNPLTGQSRMLTGLLREAELQVATPITDDYCDVSGYDFRLRIVQGEEIFREFAARRLCV